MRTIQSVRMGSQAIEERTEHTIQFGDFDYYGMHVIIELDKNNNITKELLLGPGAFIVYKETK